MNKKSIKIEPVVARPKIITGPLEETVLTFKNPNRERYVNLSGKVTQHLEGMFKIGDFGDISCLWASLHGLGLRQDDKTRRIVKDQYSIPFNKLIREYLISKLKDGLLVDLGCGSTGFMRAIAERLGVRGYIGVDIYPGYIEESDSPMQIRVCKAEMLDFLARMKSGSVDGIVLNSIDENNLPDGYFEYLYALQEEISRVLVRGGIVFGTGHPIVIDFILKNNPHSAYASTSPIGINGVIEHDCWKIVEITRYRS